MNSKQLLRRVWWCGLILALAYGLAACDDKWGRAAQALTPKRLPNPVQSKDGVSYIPIEDTAFLIPEKTWLVSYGRRSTDGMVDSFILHATVPDVQPWSPARNDEMYWPAGPGKKLLIYIKGGIGAASQAQDFYNVPNSIYSTSSFIEEPSNQSAQGLRQFRMLRPFYKDEAAEKEAIHKWGSEFVEESKRSSGKPMMYDVFYELIENDHIKYFIRCGDTWGKEQIFQSCHLFFPFTKSLMVDIYFMRNEIAHIVAMADKVNERLHEFQTAGLAHRIAQPFSSSNR